MQILLVEDDASIREMLCEFLEDEGYEVVSARHGQEALDYLGDAAAAPALIILDMAMPVLDGWGFLSARRVSPPLQAIPVIVLSADSHLRNRDDLLANTLRLQKPIQFDEFLTTVASFAR